MKVKPMSGSFVTTTVIEGTSCPVIYNLRISILLSKEKEIFCEIVTQSNILTVFYHFYHRHRAESFLDIEIDDTCIRNVIS